MNNWKENSHIFAIAKFYHIPDDDVEMLYEYIIEDYMNRSLQQIRTNNSIDVSFDTQ